MRFLLILLTLTVWFLFGCNKEENPVVKSAAEVKADSLQAIADSIAYRRQLHSMMTGAHFHKSKDLAAIAHQDPKKKVRFKRKQYEGAAAKRAAARKRNEKIQEYIQAKKNEIDSAQTTDTTQ